MGHKLIFLDIDGTLTPAGSNIAPDSAVRAIRAAQANGHRVFLCTGRNMAMLSPVLRYGFDGAVASAGGYVTCGERVVYDCPMTPEQTRTAMDVLEKNGVFRTVEARDATFGDSGLADVLAGTSEGNSELERWRKALAENLGIRPMKDYDGRPIYKVVVMCLRWEQLEEPRKFLEKDFEFCMQIVAAHSNCINGELINRKFNKGTGIQKICETLGVDIRDTVGFGDSMNDKAMIDVAGTSVGMANGQKELRELCDLECPAVEEDGIEKGFKMLGLI
jgi:Cof subfamily protein (haloacid dehalogenase superfamily)